MSYAGRWGHQDSGASFAQWGGGRGGGVMKGVPGHRKSSSQAWASQTAGCFVRLLSEVGRQLRRSSAVSGGTARPAARWNEQLTIKQLILKPFMNGRAPGRTEAPLGHSHRHRNRQRSASQVGGARPRPHLPANGYRATALRDIPVYVIIWLTALFGGWWITVHLLFPCC